MRRVRKKRARNAATSRVREKRARSRVRERKTAFM